MILINFQLVLISTLRNLSCRSLLVLALVFKYCQNFFLRFDSMANRLCLCLSFDPFPLSYYAQLKKKDQS